MAILPVLIAAGVPATQCTRPDWLTQAENQLSRPLDRAEARHQWPATGARAAPVARCNRERRTVVRGTCRSPTHADDL